MNNNRTSRFMPLLVALGIVAGIAVGTFYACLLYTSDAADER